jgi:hypothetical protein
MVASEESEVDIEVEEMQYSSEVDDDREEEEEGGEDELEESENDQQSVRTVIVLPTRTRAYMAIQTAGQAGPLKIKLKLGAQSDKPVSSRRYARARSALHLFFLDEARSLIVPTQTTISNPRTPTRRIPIPIRRRLQAAAN